MALEAKKRGAKVIALTSLQHSTACSSRQKDGYKLYQVADLVLDNQAEYGDASYYVDESEIPVGGVSDYIGFVIVQAIVVAIASKMCEKGEEPPIFRSGNVDGAEEINSRLHQKYLSKII